MNSRETGTEFQTVRFGASSLGHKIWGALYSAIYVFALAFHLMGVNCLFKVQCVYIWLKSDKSLLIANDDSLPDIMIGTNVSLFALVAFPCH